MALPIAVTLYRKPGCGLCDQAEAMLTRIGKKLPLVLTTVDIDSDEDLQKRYFLEIPVIAVDGDEIARAPINERALKAVLEDLAAEQR
ncbi:MAG: glutaredoxin family protein [bacterium]